MPEALSGNSFMWNMGVSFWQKTRGDGVEWSSFFAPTVVLYRAKIGEIWGFPKLGIPQNGWFIRDNPIKMDGLGYPYFRKPPFMGFVL